MNPYNRNTSEMVVLDSPVKVVEWSCFVHKSISHLDLSICEYTRNIKTLLTKEAFLKATDERRHLRYVLNLDVSAEVDEKLGLIHCCRNSYAVPYVTTVYVLKKVYGCHFARDIMSVIKASREQLKDVRRYIKVLRMTGVSGHTLTSEDVFDVYEFFIRIFLAYRCNDSGLLVNFFRACGPNIANWLLQQDDQYLLCYVIFITQRKRFDLFRYVEIFGCPVSQCIHTGKFNHILTLITLGITYSPRFGSKRQRRPTRYVDDVESGSDQYKRSRLLIKLLQPHTCKYKKYSDVRTALQLIYRSIADPYPSPRQVLKEQQECPSTKEMDKMYEIGLGREHHYASSQPRSLTHYCRCVVRAILFRSHSLPLGIDSLDLPKELQTYLRLIN